LYQKCGVIVTKEFWASLTVTRGSCMNFVENSKAIWTMLNSPWKAQHMLRVHQMSRL